MARVMIYGATGYTGRMAACRARALGVDFIVAGRTHGKVGELARSLETESTAFEVTNTDAVTRALKGVVVLLNCAGPFLHTAKPLMLACITARVHYLDIAAELDSYHLAQRYDQEARDKNVMLLPGCGGSVAQLGCLAVYAVEKVQTPITIEIALHVAGSMSRGSAISASENMTSTCYQVLDGKLAVQNAKATSRFDFQDGNGLVDCHPATLPDLITIGKATGVPNIKTFVHVSGDAFPTGDIRSLPDGPSAEHREANPYHAAVTVNSTDGSETRAALHTSNGYTLTPKAAIEAVRRVLAGELKSGFQTPAGLFGASFVLGIDDSKWVDI